MMAALPSFEASDAGASGQLRLSPGEIVAALGAIDPDRMPLDALRDAVARPEEVAPLLLESIAESPKRIRARIDGTAGGNECYLTPALAMFLLAVSRNRAAHLPICRFFADHGEMATYVTGDLVTTELPYILAQTFDGDASGICSIIHSETADPFARSAAANALTLLDHLGRIDRERVVDCFADLLAGAPAEANGDATLLWSLLVDAASDLRSERLMPLIKAVLDRGLHDPTILSWEGLEAECASGETPHNFDHYSPERRQDPVDHLVENVGWLIPHGLAPGEEPRPVRRDPAHGLVLTREDGSQTVAEIAMTFRRSEPKVGRNEPCPCGSGKKYKKCCIDR
jgi:hypothetical protein